MSEVTNRRFNVAAPSIRGVNWGRFFARTGAVLALLVAGGLLAVAGERLLGVGGPAPNEVRVMTFNDWRVICPPLTEATPNCALTADTIRDVGGVMLSISMTDPAPGSQLSVTVPHGVILEPGIGFSIGTEPMRVRPYETCTQAGCVALITADADTIRSLTSNMEGQVSVAAPNSQQPITIPFSLNGFAAAYNELERAKARRTGLFGFLGRS